MDPIAVTVEEARKLTGLGTTKIYELMTAGDFKRVKVGKRTLITVRSIRKFFGEQEDV